MIAIGSDHGGFALKQEIMEYLKGAGYEFCDVGCYEPKSVDYPDIAKLLCSKITSGECELGILVCGTGIGMSICANKIKGIRAAQCSDTFSARMTRCHNNSNVLTMGGRTVGPELAKDIVKEFLTAEFECGRHQTRIDKIMELE